MRSSSLTPKQHAFLGFIRSFLRKYGDLPGYKDIIDHFDFKSPNSVTQNLQALVRKGYLEREGNFYRLAEEAIQDAVGIPIRGVITAGQMQEAVDVSMGHITLESLFPNLNRVFALRVSGNSMQDAGIHDGDLVLLQDDDIPRGGIGAVRYNGETTLKRVFVDRGGLRLEPCNADHAPIHITPEEAEEVHVIGRYVGKMTDRGIFRAEA